MSNIKGFSLVELMVAVGIVGVMSSVAVPKYQKYKVNATRAEAQATLSAMYTLQQLYYTENDKYGAVTFPTSGLPPATTNDIQFPENAAYKYIYKATPSAPTGVTGSAGNVIFKGTAVSKNTLGSCAKAAKDMWCINHDKVLTNDSKSGGKDEALFNGPPNHTAAPCAAGEAVDGGC